MVPLVSERGAEPWCERCGYNIEAYEPPTGAGWRQRRIGALGHRIAYRLTMRQYRELTGGSDQRFDQVATTTGRLRAPGRWTSARLFAVAVSILMYIVIGALAYFGVKLVLLDFPGVSLIIGVLLLLMAAYLFPRVPRLDKGSDILTRDEAPTLFALVDRVAAELGTKAPRTVGVFPYFNAYTTAVGLRRRRTLMLGLALFGALDGQQRVALLAHEIGHFRNGDVRHGLFTQPAMTTLGRLASLFEGGVQFRAGRGAGVASVLLVVIQPIIGLFMAIVAFSFYFAHLGVLAVVLRDSQRREYYADQRASRLAGTRATAQLLDLINSDVAAVIASRSRANLVGPAWRDAATELLVPERAGKIRRMRQLSSRQGVSLFRTHPPAGLRAWLVEAEPYNTASLVVTQAESDRIDDELARYYKSARRDLAHSSL
jgi:heat shock protein HtpX